MVIFYHGEKMEIGNFDNINDAENAIKSFRTNNHGEFTNHG